MSALRAIQRSALAAMFVLLWAVVSFRLRRTLTIYQAAAADDRTRFAGRAVVRDGKRSQTASRIAARAELVSATTPWLTHGERRDLITALHSTAQSVNDRDFGLLLDVYANLYRLIRRAHICASSPASRCQLLCG